MELKWLEDFLSLAQTGSFSRSADARHITQSAFSRRIQALESWLGAALIDRSTYPTTLTPEGRQFRETAEDAVRMLHASRHDLQASTRAPRHAVSVAALHTLALTFFPGWFRAIEAQTGPLGSRLLSDDFHACLQALVEGGYDFLLTFHHPSAPVLLDPALCPHRVIGVDRLVLVHAGDAADAPLLGYAQNSFLGRVAAFAQADTGPPATPTPHVNENAMAEALKAMVLEGHGRAWLPHSIVAAESLAGRLAIAGPAVPLEIRLYRNAKARTVVETVWAAAEGVAGQTMRGRTEVV
ncbi:LysR family transcriptional regulator [Beijerinckia sp. L45]|uniref:LysR family transcriptional regulator n=1 Tax=Beijerinckia sp. L45 TaxID=1641855 RepID=UPI00131C568D|nr:LysR family transcriptional regulator [Beijerinckia sp. L45]